MHSNLHIQTFRIIYDHLASKHFELVLLVHLNFSNWTKSAYSKHMNHVIITFGEQISGSKSACMRRHVITSSMDQKSYPRVPALKLELSDDPPSRTTHHVSETSLYPSRNTIPFEFGSIFFLVFEKFSTSRH